MPKSVIAPHVAGESSYSPLSAIIDIALSQYGEFAPSSVDAGGKLMLLTLANNIVEEVRQHPYNENADLDYYGSLEDVIEIPDIIMVNGLKYQLAMQQGSAKTQINGMIHYQTLNRVLWNRYNGNSKVSFRPVDGGSNTSFAETTSAKNGQPE